jgi:hypothetical protein
VVTSPVAKGHTLNSSGLSRRRIWPNALIVTENFFSDEQ